MFQIRFILIWIRIRSRVYGIRDSVSEKQTFEEKNKIIYKKKNYLKIDFVG